MQTCEGFRTIRLTVHHHIARKAWGRKQRKTLLLPLIEALSASCLLRSSLVLLPRREKCRVSTVSASPCHSDQTPTSILNGKPQIAPRKAIQRTMVTTILNVQVTIIQPPYHLTLWQSRDQPCPPTPT